MDELTLLPEIWGLVLDFYLRLVVVGRYACAERRLLSNHPSYPELAFPGPYFEVDTLYRPVKLFGDTYVYYRGSVWFYRVPWGDCLTVYTYSITYNFNRSVFYGKTQIPHSWDPVARTVLLLCQY